MDIRNKVEKEIVHRDSAKMKINEAELNVNTKEP